MFISTKTIIIYWHQWAGKTMFAVLLASDYLKRLYWNVEIKYKWEKVWKKIKI